MARHDTHQSAARRALSKPAIECELLASILDAPDRDRIPGAAPVVSFDARDEAEYLAAIESSSSSTVALSRRGAWHGEWAALDPARGSDATATTRGSETAAAARRSSTGTAPAELAPRWHAARPIVLAGAASTEIADLDEVIRGRALLFDALKDRGGLRTWLSRELRDLAPRFRAAQGHAQLYDEERDIERILVSAFRADGRRLASDLWIKSSWLSTFDGEDSLRVRASFGRERHDDASRDLRRHRLTAELASALFPESDAIVHNPRIAHVVERLCGEPVLFTQHIAYWNSPDGGALFHHDAFAEDGPGGAHAGQLGVCYLQLSGRTAWLALSIRDLAERVREYLGYLDEGEAPWVRSQLFPSSAQFAKVMRLALDEEQCVAELALPGCGAFASLVNRGPEFTSFLADAGHAAVLEKGDAILLPNHGFAATAMHSVFCASEETGFSLSLAIRPDREVDLGPEVPEPDAD